MPEFRPNGPAGLRFLADWFDATRPGEDDEVQRDLRQWADDMETASATLTEERRAHEGTRAEFDSTDEQQRESRSDD